MSNIIQLTGIVPSNTITLSAATGAQQVTAVGTVAERGPAGAGLPVGGSEGQIAAKNSAADHDLKWVTPVSSVAGRTGAVALGQSDITGLTTDLSAKMNRAADTLDADSTLTLGGKSYSYIKDASNHTAITASGFPKITRQNGTDSFIEAWRSGEANARLLADGYGSLYLGGSGTAAAPHKLAKDSGNAAYLNYSNIAGPASVIIIDGNASTGSDAEATLTTRVKVASGSEFIDRFANHYTSNGDVLFGALVQKTGAGAYRDYLFGFYDAADTDPANQIKRAERFYKIAPQAAAGSTTTRRRGQIYFRPPDGSTNPSAHLHIGQGIGGATTGSAPLKIDSGTLLTTPEDGAIEYDGTHFYASVGASRRQIDQPQSIDTTATPTFGGLILNKSGAGVLADFDNDGTGTTLYIKKDGAFAGNDRALDVRINSDLGAATGTNGVYVYSNTAHSVADNAQRALFKIENDNASALNNTFTIKQDGSGRALMLDNNNNGDTINIDHDGNSDTAITGLWINVANVGTGGANAAIFEAGRVGIAKTNPGTALDVGGTVTSISSVIGVMGGGTGKLAVGGATTNLASFVNTSSTGPGFGAGMIGLSNDGAAMGNGDRLGFFLLGGAYDSANGMHNGAGISSYTTEDWSATNRGADLRFETTAAGSAGRGTKMRLNETGLALGDFDATHTLSLAASATGIAYYNTADRTTNYERVLMSWSSNIFTIDAGQKGGTGTERSLQLQSGTYNKYTINYIAGSKHVWSLNSTSSTLVGYDFGGTTSASSGTPVVSRIAPIISQSGTAGYTAFLINPTESGTGSGTKLLIDAQVGGVSKFSIDNAGNTVLAGNLTKTASNPPASAGATGATGRIEWDANYIYVCTAANTWKRAAIATW